MEKKIKRIKSINGLAEDLMLYIKESVKVFMSACHKFKFA
jgi:hypothetical protein